jgi:hypothetical protein
MEVIESMPPSGVFRTIENVGQKIKPKRFQI